MSTCLPVILPVVTDGAGVEERRPASSWSTVLLITVLALAIRLVGLGSKSLWVDEADSVYFASHTFYDIFFHLCDPHPPAYYAMLRIVLMLLGQEEFWVRLPSAVAGALAAPLLYALSRELSIAFGVLWLDFRTFVLSSLLLAVAPLHVWYSQEARMYAMVMTLGLCSVHFALRFALHGDMGSALGYVLAASAALHTDQTSVLPLLLANLLWSGIWLRQRWPQAGRGWWELATWGGLQLIIGIVFWLWWSHALFPSLFDAGTLYQLAMVMLVLQRLGLSVGLNEVRWAFAVGAALSAVIGVWGCLLLARGRRMRRLMPGLALAVIVLFVLGTIGSAIPRLFTVKRLVVSLLPYGLLISAWAMRRLQLRRWLLSVLIAFSLALCVVNVLLVPKEPWREAVSVVQQEIGPNDVLWVDELAVSAFDYYYSGSHKRLILRTAHIHELSNALGDIQDIDQRNSAGEGLIWIVTRVDPYRNLLDYLPPSFPRNLVWSGDWHRVSVRAYAMASPDAGPPVSGTDPPSWLLAWPSPVHEACQGQE
jgi:4-amino-4-deoxy-L-arabinose transferase-like glycosyltransferase